ncbi:hypothetical protein SCHPADRAFT_332155 [Schizopora paradoxa]|uniref:Uncharacterized protein n=1 Tax=Schizopora paradoxa TaxID=27342 RepID=A0A0H2SB07_9AGAM|nr:hypothetical protein SCHPADRAFT_332155 [Schizopora paradoxa]
MLAQQRSQRSRRAGASANTKPTFVYTVPARSSYVDESSSPFASSSKLPTQQRTQRRARGPSSASTLSASSSASTSSSSRSYAYNYPSSLSRSRMEIEDDESDSESSELEFGGGSPSSSSDHEAGEGWHYTYAASHPRRRQRAPTTSTTATSVSIELTTSPAAITTTSAVPAIPTPALYAPTSPKSPKRELSDANERRLSAELRRSPVPTYAHLPSAVVAPPPSSYSPPPRRSPIRAHLERDAHAAEFDDEEGLLLIGMGGDRKLRAGMALSSTSLRRRNRREGWGEFEENADDSVSTSPFESSAIQAPAAEKEKKTRLPSPALDALLPLPSTKETSSFPTRIASPAVPSEKEEPITTQSKEQEDEDDDEDEEERTPTCTDALAREWHTLVLRWRFGVFRAKRRVRGVFASRR